MNKFTTQMEAAKKGIITTQVKTVSAYEGIEPEKITKLVAEGKIAIPANKNHFSLSPRGIGKGLKTKINVNIGISKDCSDFESEMEKAKLALSMNVDSIMDLSCFGKTENFRQKLIKNSSAIIGTVPIYDAIGMLDKKLKDITSEDFLNVAKKHAVDGADFLTIHAALNKKTVERFKNNKRITNIVSRGGSILYSWMELTGNENPFYEHFDKLLEICREYDVTLSLGDSCRPGCLADATDAVQIEELITLGELTKRAWGQCVQIIIEGPGHMAINEIKSNVMLQKKLCFDAPFYVLGPLVTDIAPGYDHITSAIGGSIAAASGADFLCYVTPAEHLRLPTMEDVKEGIIAAQIAAHAGDIAKDVKGAVEWDINMSKARAKTDWNEMFKLSINPEKAKSYRLASLPQIDDSCSMCGEMCSFKTMNEYIKAN